MWFKKVNSTILIGFLTLFSFTGSAQAEDFLDNFQASLVNEKVFLTWTIKSGNTCLGINILRSTNGVDFTTVGYVEGFCGNLSAPTHYNFTDNDPVWNAINTYKLNLGGAGFSQAISIELIDVDDKGYLITPHPVENISKLHFKNDSGLLTTLNVYSSTGMLIYTESTNLNYFNVKISALDIGEYLFTLSSEISRELISGKLIVVQ